MRLHLHFTRKAAAAEAQKLKKQAVWVRMHLQGRRGRERVVLSLRATPYPSERSGASGRWSLLFPLRIGLGRMGGALQPATFSSRVGPGSRGGRGSRGGGTHSARARGRGRGRGRGLETLEISETTTEEDEGEEEGGEAMQE